MSETNATSEIVVRVTTPRGTVREYTLQQLAQQFYGWGFADARGRFKTEGDGDYARGLGYTIAGVGLDAVRDWHHSSTDRGTLAVLPDGGTDG